MAMSHRKSWLALLAVASFVLPSCQEDGNFCVLGYTTKPNYDPNIHTIHVPIFENNVPGDSITRGMEFQLTEAVVRDINLMTPFRVVSMREPADTELKGTIVNYTKTVINRNQLNELREAENALAVELIWRDLRTGEILSRPRRLAPPPPLPEDAPPPPPPSVQVISLANFIPEIGQSGTSARKVAIDRMAVQIVSMMETPW
jgi:hypothetical protein